MDVDSIAKQFTRFFVPGLAFEMFAIVIPAALLGHNFSFGKDAKLGISEGVLISILAGYVLDSIKGYRWTPALRCYNARKRDLTAALAKHTKDSSQNPDHHLARLWRHDEVTYNRIFIERAEWVMILETSFSLFCGAFSTFAVGIHSHLEGRPWPKLFWGIPFILFLASVLSSRNGIDRMVSHDSKLIEAIKNLNEKLDAESTEWAVSKGTGERRL